MAFKRLTTVDEVKAAIKTGAAYLGTYLGRKTVLSYNDETGWASVDGGRSFMVCITDIMVDCTEVEAAEAKVAEYERELERLKALKPSRVLAERIYSVGTMLLTWRDEVTRLRTGGVVTFVKSICKHCGKPSDRAENVCSACKYGLR